MTFDRSFSKYSPPKDTLQLDRRLMNLVAVCKLRYSREVSSSVHFREPFWKAHDLYSRAILREERLLFACLSFCAAFTICEPFWKARDLYSCAFVCRVCFFLGLPNGTYQLWFSTSPCHCAGGRAIIRSRRPCVSWIVAPTTLFFFSFFLLSPTSCLVFIVVY